ncbi:phytanoyl-CoA dioxygenase family protein [Novosphingobium terrae]|uniref:phytanoyl-CoA dioxygenase family protein n=1 Tax=Novosphingobium terrae TaxID=2726189 RepID=UPI00197FEAA5|nr:phytanoyl-CoA dioxygenase family protein [Novosphingobium terrae]
MIKTVALEQAIAQYAAALQSQGYCVIKNAVAAGLIHQLERDLEEDFRETPFSQGGFYGSTTKRFGRLLIRSSLAKSLVQHLTVLGVVEKLLLPWCDRIQLNTTQAIEIHPGAPAQMPHRDQDMWRGPVGEVEYLVNVMWPITTFTKENGATRVWPSSHGARALDQDPASKPVAVEMKPGSALLFLGSALHGAGPNLTDEVRRGIVIGYSLGWLKPYENQWLAYPPEVAKTFSPELAALVGYRQHRPNLGNFEGQCPSVLLGSHVRKRLGAIDALRPDQERLIEAYNRERGPDAAAEEL